MHTTCPRVFLLPLTVLATTVLHAQTPRSVPSAYTGNPPVNYVRTWEAVAPTTDPNTLTLANDPHQAKIATQYLDGLGRPLQTVVKKGALVTDPNNLQSAANAKDLVSPVEYDAFGRVQHSYLPFAANNRDGNPSISDGLFKLNPFQQQETFSQARYPGETFYYGHTVYEASPLNRVIGTLAPGNSWVGATRGVATHHWINTAADAVRIWSVTNGPNSDDLGSYATLGTYPAGELYKTVTQDEHGKQVIEFKDKEGKVILKKVQLTASADLGSGDGHTGWLSTYYLYDDLGQLRCVVQPEGVKKLADPNLGFNWNLAISGGVLLREQCFRYAYDGRGRMTIKQVPGAGPVYMVYDARDRLVLTQDAGLRRQNPTTARWLFTKYDQLNRPTVTGFYHNPTHTGQAAMQAFCNSQSGLAFWETYNPSAFPLYTLTQSFPVYNSTNGDEVLTFTYYDDYAWAQAHGSHFAAKNNSFDNLFAPPSGTIFPYPQPLAATAQTKGLVTGVCLLLPAGGTVTGTYYDEKGRVVQTQAYNHTAGPGYASGIDVVTHQYSFSGQLLQTVERVQKAGTNPQELLVQTRYGYDELGRLVQTEKKVAVTENGQTVAINNGDWKTTSQTEYDALGQVKKKKLGADPVNTSLPLETLAYDYNVRGWLLGANKAYLTGADPARFFGFELGYDRDGLAPNASKQYNGNIGHQAWRSKGDGEVRKYDYLYDAANRLTYADFNQYTGNAATPFNKSAGLDFSVGNLGYDGNGNILSMQQSGWKIGGSQVIDNLAYAYYDHANRLKAVIDGANNQQSILGDFKYEAATKAAVDYGYDANGNLTADLNKKIGGTAGGIDPTTGLQTSGGAIAYNHLNLPETISVAGKGTITYAYDPAGTKLTKRVVESLTSPQYTGTKTITTLYLGGAVFESRAYVPQHPDQAANADYHDRLQFIAHEEGRLRPLRNAQGTITTLLYDYMLKDHLGNVRAVITEEQKADFYPRASMENVANRNNLADTSNYIPYYVNTDYTPPNGGVRQLISSITGYPTQPSDNQYTARTNGSGQKVGPAIVLRVTAGDKVNIRVESFWKMPPPGSTADFSPASILMDLAQGLFALGSLPGAKATLGELTQANPFEIPVEDFLEVNQPLIPNSQKPRAYLSGMLFDERFKLVLSSSGADPVGDADAQTGVAWKEHLVPGFTIPTSGYLVIFTSNETQNLDVFWDNLQVSHIRGPLLEETHYYPFGLAMHGISSKAATTLENKKGYNGNEIQNKEFSDGSGLEWYDFNARGYDQQLGRFMQVDPLANEGGQESLTPFQFGLNDPIRYNDPDGKCPICPAIPIIFEGVKALAAAYIAYKTTEAAKPLIDKVVKTVEEKTSTPDPGTYSHPQSQKPLPRTEGGEPKPDPDATGPHTQLGRKDGRKGDYNQAREFDANGKPVKDIDFTDHGRNKPNPHQHPYKPGQTGGTLQRGATEPLKVIWEVIKVSIKINFFL